MKMAHDLYKENIDYFKKQNKLEIMIRMFSLSKSRKL